jgi:hypothetical protein
MTLQIFGWEKEGSLVQPFGTGVAKGLPFDTINGKTGDASGGPITIKQGDRVRIRIYNASQQTHAMHLHGHDEVVVSKNGHAVPQVRETTQTVNPGDFYELEFTANNPGNWIFHCHFPHHTANGISSGYNGAPVGMTRIFHYQGAPEETIDPRRRGQPGERRREVVTIVGPQPPQGRTATPLCIAGGGGWGTHTPVGTNARAPAPGGRTAHVVVETFRQSPTSDWSSAAVPAWYTHRVTWPRTAAPLARRTLTLTPPTTAATRCSAHVPLPSPAVQAHDHRPWRVTCPPGTGRHRTAMSTTARSSHRIHPRTASVYHRCWCRSRHRRLGRGCKTTGRPPR